MKLVTFEVGTRVGPVERLGVLHKGRVVDINFAHALMGHARSLSEPQRLADTLVPAEIIAWLDMGQTSLRGSRDALSFLDKTLKKRGAGLKGIRGESILYRPGEVRLLSPLPRPRSLKDFFAFEEHALQGAARRHEPLAPEWYHQPLYYKGNHREIYGPGDIVPWPSYTRRMDFELEIAAVVGRKGRDLTPEQAGKHIAGYTILNDFSARDIQKNEMICRVGPGKGKDFATAMGPYLLTADELPSSPNLKMTAYINGRKWSSARSKDRYWSLAVMLSHVSQEETVYPGDVLGSGTYFKGCGLDLDRWIKPGDTISLEVERLGVLKNKIGPRRGQKHLKYSRKAAKAGF